MGTTTTSIAFIATKFRESPAEWTTAILLLLTLLFTMYLTWASRRKIKIYYGKRPYHEDMMRLVATNVSAARAIRILRYGYKDWNGQEWSDDTDENLEIDFRQGWNLQILSGGKYMNVKDRALIYYAFVEDTAGRKYKKYAYWQPISWIIRFWYRIIETLWTTYKKD